jgi:ATP-dependent helicase Lhr and Lhr-like helicase
VPLSSFTPRVREWFSAAFAAPTPAQAQAWPAIARGEHVLLSAPTGSGKTLAAFLWALDRLSGEGISSERRGDDAPGSDEPAEGPETGGAAGGSGRAGGQRLTRVVYVSPLKALAYDIERNLRAPLNGIWGAGSTDVRVGIAPATRPSVSARRCCATRRTF